jgi:pimeloyl-ACP methyl ester carboxylesterase
MRTLPWLYLASLCAVLTAALPLTAASAQTKTTNIGIVIMHGKGGSPARLVNTLAEALEGKGLLVASLEMPWAGNRNYDKDITGAEQEVSAALNDLRGKGAKKVFIAGHSQGAVFALHYAGKHPVDGLIIIAPGGNVGTRFYQQKVGTSVERARSLIASGKGNERDGFDEFEGGKGNWTVNTTAAIYFSWFDPDGAMNQMKSSRALPQTLPVLHVAPTSDYPALQRSRQAMFDALPDHSLKRLYEPDTDHRGAPAASADEIARWTAEVAAR